MNFKYIRSSSLILKAISIKILVLLGIKGSSIDLIKNQNPTCNISKSCTVSSVKLGGFVSLLENTCVINTDISDYSYVGASSHLNTASVGKYCSIGPNVQIGLGSHPTKDYVSTYPAFYSNKNAGCAKNIRDDKIFDDSPKKTSIGHDVWIGANCIIPGGISIGIGAIVAAGSVVVKDVPAYAVVGGNPAQIIRYRFLDKEVGVLLASEWWDWSFEKINCNVNAFSDIEKFKMVD